VGSLTDVITCAKFQDDILQGREFTIFLLIFAWALQQCSTTALPVIVVIWIPCNTLTGCQIVFSHCIFA